MARNDDNYMAVHDAIIDFHCFTRFICKIYGYDVAIL